MKQTPPPPSLALSKVQLCFSQRCHHPDPHRANAIERQEQPLHWVPQAGGDEALMAALSWAKFR